MTVFVLGLLSGVVLAVGLVFVFEAHAVRALRWIDDRFNWLPDRVD